ncbi:MAG: ATP-dependent helicase [Dehalococcoidia bacterium]|nr:ATP-dependent helicase [Dehalococcoidia bacterium]
MPWHDSLIAGQLEAASHSGNHARLLAGPGTGKTFTLTRHIRYLVEEKGVEPDRILAFTFTRAAAQELNSRVGGELGEGKTPRISTLHSFALRQLLKNSHLSLPLPQPLRIADDWEERHIVLDDLKALLGLSRVSDAQDLVNQLSADWQSLTAEAEDWEKRFPNPQFLAAWREHRGIYGYTLRSELVYRLKQALENRDDFHLESPIEHLVVDEYQDLNRCDLAVVNHIASRDVELFVAGDDDQSIYGFRKAHPDGIRRFPDDYLGASELELEICKRCDRSILEFGLFVAAQDYERTDKAIRPEADAADGEVKLLKFPNQGEEARGIAKICSHLVGAHQMEPHDILILLRSDTNGVFSGPIKQALLNEGLPVSESSGVSPLDEPVGRGLLAFLRLLVQEEDSLAWRALLKVWCDGIGRGTLDELYKKARSRSETFAQIVLAAHASPEILELRYRGRVSSATEKFMAAKQRVEEEGLLKSTETRDELLHSLWGISAIVVGDPSEAEPFMERVERTVDAFDLTTIEETLRMLEVESEGIEQEVEEGQVNILTMHRAKGLTAEAVVVAVAEDEYLPGRAQGDEIGDERRLLYVSLTRAKHHLFVTYCNRRIGQQSHYGRNRGTPVRNISRFLEDSPIPPQGGAAFIDGLAESLQDKGAERVSAPA